MTMWELHEGERRDLNGIFSRLKRAYVKRIEIRGPYCAAKTELASLELFLLFARGAADTIEHLTLRCRETKDRDGYVEFYLDVEAPRRHHNQLDGIQKPGRLRHAFEEAQQIVP